MKNLELKYRKLLRKIFGGVSLTAMAFVFQACYGIERDPFYDIRLTGTVKSKTTNLPIQGIKVTINGGEITYGFTDEKGKFDFYASVPNEDYIHHYNDGERNTHDSVRVHFLDIDGIRNGYFEDKIIIINPAYKDEVIINAVLENKQ